jgi:hypothetical protein
MHEVRNAYRILIGNPERKILLGVFNVDDRIILIWLQTSTVCPYSFIRLTQTSE